MAVTSQKITGVLTFTAILLSVTLVGIKQVSTKQLEAIAKELADANAANVAAQLISSKEEDALAGQCTCDSHMDPKATKASDYPTGIACSRITTINGDKSTECRLPCDDESCKDTNRVSTQCRVVNDIKCKL